MRRQFLYGRKKTGYCQVNDDYPVTDKRTLLQLTSVQNYSVSGLDINNLPEAYYAYSERLEGERVWIEGKTSFVPAGTSEESGSRDTCMVHKIIYSDKDYMDKLLKPVSEPQVSFCSTVEEYLSGSGKPIDDMPTFDYKQLYEKFGLDDEKMKDFIICCLEVFPSIEKRVYCYLPTADREGSIWAKRLMETIISNVPACVVSGAGFITYTNTFHSMSTNPIPGSISVVFIPDTDDNIANERTERRNHYVFDFKNYQKQSSREGGYVGSLIDFILKKIKGEDSNGLTELLFQKMNDFVKMGYAVDIDFLGAYMIYSMRDKLGTIKDSKFRRTLAMAIHDLLHYEEALTEEAKQEIENVVMQLLYGVEYTEADFEWIDKIHNGGDLCKNIVLRYLCDSCLNHATVYPADQNEKILFITNYEYEEEELNDDILEALYSQTKYYPVAQRLVKESLKPLTVDTKKTTSKKIDMLCSYLKNVSKQYSDFAVSAEFKQEFGEVLLQCLKKSDDKQADFSDMCFKINSISAQVYETYRTMLQKFAYFILNDFVKKRYYEDADEEELAFYSNLIEEWKLSAFEVKHRLETSVVQIIEEEIKKRSVGRVFAGRDEKKLLHELKKHTFNDAVALCKKNIRRIEVFLDQFAQDEEKENICRNELYRYFYATGFTEIMEEVLQQICDKEGLDGLRIFCGKAKASAKDEEKSVRIISGVLKKNSDLWESKKKISLDNEDFLAKYGIVVVPKVDDKKKKNAADDDDDYADAYMRRSARDKQFSRGGFSITDQYGPSDNSRDRFDSEDNYDDSRMSGWKERGNLKKDTLSEEERYLRDVEETNFSSDTETTKKKKGFSFFGRK